jgi:hypothetical protein
MEGAWHAAFALKLAHVAHIDEGHLAAPVERTSRFHAPRRQ